MQEVESAVQALEALGGVPDPVPFDFYVLCCIVTYSQLTWDRSLSGWLVSSVVNDSGFILQWLKPFFVKLKPN